jgi:hypothetical protein
LPEEIQAEIMYRLEKEHGTFLVYPHKPSKRLRKVFKHWKIVYADDTSYSVWVYKVS